MVYKLLSLETDTATQVPILDKAVCISYTANILKKVMNPAIFPSRFG